MFRHKDKPKQLEKEENKDKKTEREAESAKKETTVLADKEDDVKELLEKNLKWSQIIYEQNRKINHKLMWAAVAGWLRLFLILAPLVLAIFYLLPVIKDVWSKFGTITSVVGSGGVGAQSGSLEDLIKVFNLSPSQIEQVKGLLK